MVIDMTEKRFVGNFQGKMLVSIRDKKNNCNVNILQIVEIANKLSNENEQLKSTNMEMEDYLGRLEESCIISSKRLKQIRDYAKEYGEIKYEMIGNLFTRGVLESDFDNYCDGDVK